MIKKRGTARSSKRKPKASGAVASMGVMVSTAGVEVHVSLSRCGLLHILAMFVQHEVEGAGADVMIPTFQIPFDDHYQSPSEPVN